MIVMCSVPFRKSCEFLPSQSFLLPFQARLLAAAPSVFARVELCSFLCSEESPLRPVLAGWCVPFKTQGVRGIVIDPEGEDNAHHARHIANQRECSHTCQTSKLCVGYTWIGKDTESILGALKAILSIGMDEDDTAGGGSCYLFDAAQAKKLHAVQYHQHGQSGIKKKHLSDFSPRLQVMPLWCMRILFRGLSLYEMTTASHIVTRVHYLAADCLHSSRCYPTWTQWTRSSFRPPPSRCPLGEAVWCVSATCRALLVRAEPRSES